MRLVFLILTLITLATPLRAEGRFALVLAVGDYDHLRDLKNPGNDAVEMKAQLEGLGFEVTLETDRDARRTRRALENFAEDAAGAEIALIYWAGHGVEIAGENHLLPADADASSAEALAETALPLSEVADLLTDIAPNAILLIDACREDPFTGTPLSGEGRGAVALEDAGDPVAAAIAPGFARIGRADGLLYAFATAPGAVAQDGKGAHSPYAEALLRHLAKPGLSLPSVLTLVAQDVYDRSDNRQLPYFESALPDLVFIAAPPPDLSERDALLMAMAGLTPDLRAEVERIAAQNGVPLAPLYAALLSADLAGLTLVEREARLTEAATEYRAFIAQTASLGTEDSRVTALRDAAAELMRLGAYGEAQAKYGEALALGTARAATASDALIAETVSLVETMKASALAARAALDYATALERYRQIADALARVEPLGLPDGPMLDRSWALINLGDILISLGQGPAALEVFSEVQDVLEARVTADPEHESWLRELSVSYLRTGSIHQLQGNRAAAEADLLAALHITQRLAASDPTDSRRQMDLSVAHDGLGFFLLVQGDLPGAEAEFQKSLALIEAVVRAHPDAADWKLNLAIAHNRIAEVRIQSRDLFGGKAAITRSKDILVQLVAEDPDNPEWQRQLSVAMNGMGDVHFALGEMDEAEAAYQEGLRLREALILRDPQNTEQQRDLSISLERIGDLRLALKDLEGAEAAYLRSLKIALALVARDPTNGRWQRDLSVSYSTIGDVRGAQGDVAGAKEAYLQALAIDEALVRADSRNIQSELDLVASNVRLSEFEEDPLPRLETALAILERLQSEGRLPPTNERWIHLVREYISAAKP